MVVCVPQAPVSVANLGWVESEKLCLQFCYLVIFPYQFLGGWVGGG